MSVLTYIISGITLAAIVCCLVFNIRIHIKKMQINLYLPFAVIGVILLLCFGCVPISTVAESLFQNTPINPIKLLILFFSMTLLSIFLDEVGFFRFLANLMLKRAHSDLKKLFVYLYLIVSVLTVFTSNDIIILTLTPFIIYFCRSANIDPLPFLLCEFVAANTLSMTLIIGNPTNIFLATTFGIGFFDYFAYMILPSVLSAAAAFFLMRFIFRKQLSQTPQIQLQEVKIENKFLLITGVVHLSLCIVILAVSSYVGWDMWLICLVFALSMTVCAAIYSLFKRESAKVLLRTYKRLPYPLIPFVLSMFVLVLALSSTELLESVQTFLSSGNTIFSYGFAAFLSSNILNNIPMSLLFTNIISGITGETLLHAVFAAIIGSNIGAYLTPIGALAGIMWLNIMEHHNVKLSFARFIKHGIIISLPVMVIALCGLCLSFLIL